jgi:hypothetical protein
MERNRWREVDGKSLMEKDRWTDRDGWIEVDEDRSMERVDHANQIHQVSIGRSVKTGRTIRPVH